MSPNDDPADTIKNCNPATHERPGFLQKFFLTNSLLAGVSALAWLLLRSGPKPSRFAYPCQQAAFSAASLALGAPLVALLITARRHIAAGLRRPAGVVIVAGVIVAGLGISGVLIGVDAVQGTLTSPPPSYRAELFHVSSCPQDPVADRFPGLEELVRLMGGG